MCSLSHRSITFTPTIKLQLQLTPTKKKKKRLLQLHGAIPFNAILDLKMVVGCAGTAQP